MKDLILEASSSSIVTRLPFITLLKPKVKNLNGGGFTVGLMLQIAFSLERCYHIFGLDVLKKITLLLPDVAVLKTFDRTSGTVHVLLIFHIPE